MSVWVDRLQEITGWDGYEWDFDWGDIQAELGTALPSDFKELCERFGPGYFSSTVWVKCDEDNDPLWSWWRRNVENVSREPSEYGRLYEPYGLYGVSGKKGLLNWGASDAPALFFWLADADENPDAWPILISGEPASNQWITRNLATSEFLYNLVKYPESETFSMRDPEAPPSFTSLDPDD